MYVIHEHNYIDVHLEFMAVAKLYGILSKHPYADTGFFFLRNLGTHMREVWGRATGYFFAVDSRFKRGRVHWNYHLEK